MQPLSGPGTAPDLHPGAVQFVEQVRRWTLPDPQPVSAVLNDAWCLVDGSGVAITVPPNTKGYGKIDYPCRVTGCWVLAAQSGSVVVDILKSTYADFPTFTSITGGAFPTLSGGQKYENVDLDGSGWTTILNRADILEFRVNSVSTIQLLLIVLRLRRLDLTAQA